MSCLEAQASPVADPSVPEGWEAVYTDHPAWSLAVGGEDTWAVSTAGDVWCQHGQDGWALVQARGPVAASRLAVGAGALYAGVNSSGWSTTIYRWDAGWEAVYELPDASIYALFARADGPIVALGPTTEGDGDGGYVVNTSITEGSGDSWATVTLFTTDSDAFLAGCEDADGDLVLGGLEGTLRWQSGDGWEDYRPAGGQYFRTVVPLADGGILATTEAWAPGAEGEPDGFVVRGERGALVAADLGAAFDVAVATADGAAWVGAGSLGSTPAIRVDDGSGWREVDGAVAGTVSDLAARPDGTVLASIHPNDAPAAFFAGTPAGLAPEWTAPAAIERIDDGHLAPDGTAWFGGWGFTRWGRDGEAAPVAPELYVYRVAANGAADAAAAISDGFGGTSLVTWDGVDVSEPWLTDPILSLSGGPDGSMYAIERTSYEADPTILIERIGTGWARVDPSDPDDEEHTFNADLVFTLGFDDVLGLAAGHGFVTLARWDGAGWTFLGELASDDEPSAIWAAGPDDVWFGLRASTEDGLGRLYHWNGATMAVVADAPVNLRSLAGNHAGVYVTGGEDGDTLYAWDGAAWSARATFPRSVEVAASDAGLLVYDGEYTAYRSTP